MPILVDRIVLYRFLIILFAFGPASAALIGSDGWASPQTRIGLWVPFVVGIFLSFIYLLLLLWFSRMRLSKAFLAIQYILDTLLLIFPVIYTDATSSGFLVFYVLVVFAASVTYSPRFGLTIALLSSAIIAAISYFEMTGKLPNIPALTNDNQRFFLVAQDVLYSIIFLLLGVLPGKIVQRYRRKQDHAEIIRRDYRIARELYRLIVEHIPSGIVLLDEQMQVMLLNRAGRKIIADLKFTDETTFIQELFKAGKAKTDHNWYELELNHHVIGASLVELNPERAVANVLIIFQDITMRKQLERSLEEQKRLAAVGQLSAGLAHELRNPLAAVSNSLQILAKRLTLDDDMQRLFSIQEREIKRLSHLTSEFLQYAKPKLTAFTTFNLGEKLFDILEQLQRLPEAKHKAIAFEQRLPLEVTTDLNLLMIIVNNLVQNALQWSNNGQTVIVRVFARPEQQICIQVEDHGPGIAKDEQAHIFDPFFSKRDSGTGLGLSIAWTCAATLQGRLELVESTPGKTLFEFTFPIKIDIRFESTQATW